MDDDLDLWAALEAQAARKGKDALRDLEVMRRIGRLNAEYQKLDPSLEESSRQGRAFLESSGPIPRGEESRTPRAPAPLIERWGKYVIEKHLGSGANGDVYLARDPNLDMPVAIKLFQAATAGGKKLDSATIEDVRAEGRKLAKFQHENVVKVYMADVIDGRPGLCMEYVRGKTLGAIVRDTGTFGEQEAIDCGLKLCRTLSAIHGRGYVHRDIKAENVMRTDRGRIVLMDFGIAARLPRDPGGALHGSVGTPYYMAPEVLLNGQTRSEASDIYSLGVLLFHLLTGTYPVTGRTEAEFREAHKAGRRHRLREARSDLSLEFINVVERALARNPRDRFRSMAEMESALEDLGRVSPGRRKGLTNLQVALLAVGAVAVAVSVFWAFGRAPVRDSTSHGSNGGAGPAATETAANHDSVPGGPPPEPDPGRDPSGPSLEKVLQGPDTSRPDPPIRQPEDAKRSPAGPPIARFRTDPTAGNTNTSFVFTAERPADARESWAGLQYHWDWGEPRSGAYSTSEPVARHTFSTPGRKIVTLRVQDSQGAEGVFADTILVCASPRVRLKVTPEEPDTHTRTVLSADSTVDADTPFSDLRFAWSFQPVADVLEIEGIGGGPRRTVTWNRPTIYHVRVEASDLQGNVGVIDTVLNVVPWEDPRDDIDGILQTYASVLRGLPKVNNDALDRLYGGPIPESERSVLAGLTKNADVIAVSWKMETAAIDEPSGTASIQVQVRTQDTFLAETQKTTNLLVNLAQPLPHGNWHITCVKDTGTPK